MLQALSNEYLAQKNIIHIQNIDWSKHLHIKSWQPSSTIQIPEVQKMGSYSSLKVACSPLIDNPFLRYPTHHLPWQILQ